MNWFKNLFRVKKQETDENNERDLRAEKIKREKEEATAKHEPWVAILSMDVDYDNIATGSFELDWNEFFVTRLIRAGYQGKTDADLVDQWFNAVCRNVVMESYEQEAADRHPVKSRKLDDGRREYN